MKSRPTILQSKQIEFQILLQEYLLMISSSIWGNSQASRYQTSENQFWLLYYWLAQFHFLYFFVIHPILKPLNIQFEIRKKKEVINVELPWKALIMQQPEFGKVAAEGKHCKKWTDFYCFIADDSIIKRRGFGKDNIVKDWWDLFVLNWWMKL